MSLSQTMRLVETVEMSRKVKTPPFPWKERKPGIMVVEARK